MKIEQIRRVSETGLGNVDWTFPSGPVLLFFEDKNSHGMIGKLLLDQFYILKSLPVDGTLSGSKTKSCRDCVELWLSGKTGRFYVRQELIGDGQISTSTLLIEDETGMNVSLPAGMKLGDYLLQIKETAFQQGCTIEWPESDKIEHFTRQVRNLGQVGEEGLNFSKVRSSMAGAFQKVTEQKGSMILIKEEYDALRREWESARHQQDEHRLLLIEIKNLQEKEGILTERIASATKIQERLEVLNQNQDYRELRQLQGELIRLENHCRASDSNLSALTSESPIDWSIIESLRSECTEWACLQEDVDRLKREAQQKLANFSELQTFLQSLGFQDLPEDEDQHLLQLEKERDAAQKELDKLTVTKSEIERIQQLLPELSSRLQDYMILGDITVADEIKLAQKVKHLQLWQNSKIANSFDATLQKQLGMKSIGEKLASRLDRYYKSYQTSSYQEFRNRLQEFRVQKQQVERMQRQLEQLQEKVRRENKLLKIVQSRNGLIQQALTAAKAHDLQSWLKGWKDYQQKKQQLTDGLRELQLEQEKPLLEVKLAECAQQLRVKLENWETPVSNRDEVLTIVCKVASQLRVKDEAEREFAEYSQKYHDLLGQRNLEQLAKVLEPLAELEREIRLPEQERREEMATKQKERLETRQLRADAEERLRSSQPLPTLSVLEKKIDTVKQQWLTYENLRRALEDAQTLLETSWQEWQTKYGKALNEEAKWIISQITPASSKEMPENDLMGTKRDYFAFRMALARLAVHHDSEAPLFFSVGKVTEGDLFWEAIFGYFLKLSLSRQIILSTSDLTLVQMLEGTDWTILRAGS